MEERNWKKLWFVCVCVWGGGIKKVCESCGVNQTLSSNGLDFQLKILVFYSIQANTDLCTVDDQQAELCQHWWWLLCRIHCMLLNDVPCLRQKLIDVLWYCIFTAKGSQGKKVVCMYGLSALWKLSHNLFSVYFAAWSFSRRHIHLTSYSGFPYDGCCVFKVSLT